MSKAKKYVISRTYTRSDFLGDQTAWDITDDQGNGFFVSWRGFTSSFVPDCRNPECMAFPLTAKGVGFNEELDTIYRFEPEEALEKMIEVLGIDVDLDRHKETVGDED